MGVPRDRDVYKRKYMDRSAESEICWLYAGIGFRKQFRRTKTRKPMQRAVDGLAREFLETVTSTRQNTRTGGKISREEKIYPLYIGITFPHTRKNEKKRNPCSGQRMTPYGRLWSPRPLNIILRGPAAGYLVRSKSTRCAWELLAPTQFNMTRNEETKSHAAARKCPRMGVMEPAIFDRHTAWTGNKKSRTQHVCPLRMGITFRAHTIYYEKNEEN
jgi:hypothetical protein